MQHKQYTPRFIRQRRFLTVLPLLVFPFLTFIFWSLGGGKGGQAHAQDTKKGFNMQLPGANLKDDKPKDKLSYYEQASADSLKLRQQIKNDPYYRAEITGDTLQHLNADTGVTLATSEGNKGGSASSSKSYSDPNEARVYRKLAQLNAAINKPAPQYPAKEASVGDPGQQVDSRDVDRLEQMMNNMAQKEEPDPEVQQLNGMLGKILDIQHPELVRERLRQQSDARRGIVLPVTAAGQDDPVSTIGNHTSLHGAQDSAMPAMPRRNGFYSIDDGQGTDRQNAIEAVIHQTQTLVNGSTVKLRLVNDVFVNGMLIPRNSFVFGAAQLNGERLTVKITGIRYRSSLFPVELSVFDMDGMAGIYIPGAITRDVAKESADRSVQEVGISTMDQSLGVQAAGAGIQAAKTLFSRKVRLIKVTVKAGYQVLLRDEKQKQNN